MGADSASDGMESGGAYPRHHVVGNAVARRNPAIPALQTYGRIYKHTPCVWGLSGVLAHWPDLCKGVRGGKVTPAPTQTAFSDADPDGR